MLRPGRRIRLLERVGLSTFVRIWAATLANWNMAQPPRLQYTRIRSFLDLPAARGPGSRRPAMSEPSMSAPESRYGDSVRSLDRVNSETRPGRMDPGKTMVLQTPGAAQQW